MAIPRASPIPIPATILRDANVRAVLPVRRLGLVQRRLGRAIAHEQSLQDCACEYEQRAQASATMS
jgi:hypothetical protein